ncbi:MAG: archease [Pseudomonadota bacterium]|nr:archease [Pseudomonadota bacterium]
MTEAGCSASSGWEHFPHGADIGVRGVGATLTEAFEQAALAMTAVIAEPKNIDTTASVEITATAPDVELLLADWLNALIYEMAARNMLFSHFQVETDGKRLQAIAAGEPVDANKHRPAVEIKGATYTELKVFQRPDGRWIAQCVVDV